MPLAGVLSVLCTPFADSGALDLPSLRRQVEHSLDAGADAVVCFGLAGELYKLSDDERERVLAAAVEAASGRPVIAGTEHSGIEAAIARSVRAADLGASGLMLYPPTFMAPSPDEVVAYYAEVGQATGLPIIVQDAPAWTRVPLPLELLAEVDEATPVKTYVKVEAPPTAPKLRALAAAGGCGIGGYGALHLPEEVDAGIVATMPGAGLPHLYVRLWRTLQQDAEAGLKLHASLLPLLSFQMSGLDLFVSVQKHLLVRQGVLSSAHMRRPGKALDREQRRWLDRLLQLSQLGDLAVDWSREPENRSEEEKQ